MKLFETLKKMGAEGLVKLVLVLCIVLVTGAIIISTRTPRQSSGGFSAPSSRSLTGMVPTGGAPTGTGGGPGSGSGAGIAPSASPAQPAPADSAPVSSETPTPSRSDSDQNSTSRSSQSASAARITVEVVTLAPSVIQRSLRLTGDVLARSRVSLVPDTAGRVTRVLVRPGDSVNRGDPVAMVDPSRPGSPFAESPVRATVSGTVLAMPVSVGDTVSTGTVVAQVGSLGALEVVSAVPEKYIGQLRTGLPAALVFEAWPERSFPATLAFVGPVVDPATRTVEVRMDFSDPQGLALPGMYASISLVTAESRSTMVVPRTALRSWNSADAVYIVDEAGVARVRPVTLGLTNDRQIELVSGVQFGDRVISAGSVTDGTAVRAVERGGN